MDTVKWLGPRTILYYYTRVHPAPLCVCWAVFMDVTQWVVLSPDTPAVHSIIMDTFNRMWKSLWTEQDQAEAPSHVIQAPREGGMGYEAQTNAGQNMVLQETSGGQYAYQATAPDPPDLSSQELSMSQHHPPTSQAQPHAFHHHQQPSQHQITGHDDVSCEVNSGRSGVGPDVIHPRDGVIPPRRHIEAVSYQAGPAGSRGRLGLDSSHPHWFHHTLLYISRRAPFNFVIIVVCNGIQFIKSTC